MQHSLEYVTIVCLAPETRSDRETSHCDCVFQLYAYCHDWLRRCFCQNGSETQGISNSNSRRQFSTCSCLPGMTSSTAATLMLLLGSLVTLVRRVALSTQVAFSTFCGHAYACSVRGVCTAIYVHVYRGGHPEKHLVISRRLRRSAFDPLRHGNAERRAVHQTHGAYLDAL